MPATITKPDSLAMNIEARPTEYNAWNPGLESELPREYLPLSTMFRSENVSTSGDLQRSIGHLCRLADVAFQRPVSQ